MRRRAGSPGMSHPPRTVGAWPVNVPSTRAPTAARTALQWAGRCPGCGAWNTLVEEREEAPARCRLAAVAPPLPITQVDPRQWQARSTGDRRARPGARRRARPRVGDARRRRAGHRQVHAAAAGARRARASRRSLPLRLRRGVRRSRCASAPSGSARSSASCGSSSECACPASSRHIEQLAPELVVVDSIQTVYDPELGIGARRRSRRCASARSGSCEVAKRTRHLPRCSSATSPRTASSPGPGCSSTSSTPCSSFEGDRHHALRLLRAVKHRFGSTDELGLFEMGDAGLAGVPDPSALFLADRRSGVPGSVVVPTLEGHRRCSSRCRRSVVAGRAPRPAPVGPGPRSGRLALLLAVLEQRVGLVARRRRRLRARRRRGPGRRAGRRPRRSRWPSRRALTGRALPADLVACGEVGLGGELRQVRADARGASAEAARLGFRRPSCPRSAPEPPPGIEVIRVGTLRRALVDWRLDLRRPRPSARSPPGGAHGADAARTGTIAPWHLVAALTLVRRPRAAVAPGTAAARGPRPHPARRRWARSIVVGDGPEVLNICSGGFLLDAAFSPQRLSELAKMDGAIILAADASRIARANVHLVPEPERAHLRDRHPPPHRRAGGPLDRRAGDLGVRGHGDHRRLRRRREAPARADPPAARTGPTRRCRPSSATRTRLDEVSAALSALEVEDLVTMRDVRHRCCSAPRWSCASPRRSRATSSSSASTAASSGCSSRSCWAASRTTAPRGARLLRRRTTGASIEDS